MDRRGTKDLTLLVHCPLTQFKLRFRLYDSNVFQKMKRRPRMRLTFENFSGLGLDVLYSLLEG
jgi:hypothetical protein